MGKPKLTREDCDDIRRMYADRTRKVGTTNLAHLFHVSCAVVNNVLNNTYTPLEEYEEKVAQRRGASKQMKDNIFSN
jgi:hypothetical protein